MRCVTVLSRAVTDDWQAGVMHFPWHSIFQNWHPSETLIPSTSPDLARWWCKEKSVWYLTLYSFLFPCEWKRTLSRLASGENSLRVAQRSRLTSIQVALLFIEPVYTITVLSADWFLGPRCDHAGCSVHSEPYLICPCRSFSLFRRTGGLGLGLGLMVWSWRCPTPSAARDGLGKVRLGEGERKLNTPCFFGLHFDHVAIR